MRSFETQPGTAAPLLCSVGAALAARLPGQVPRKELFEAFEVAQVVQRHFAEAPRITEFCAGCGLLSIFLVLLKPSRQLRCLDKRRGPLAVKLLQALRPLWPCLAQIEWQEQDARHGLGAQGELVASCHACSVLSDEIILAAKRGRSPLVLVPCCYQKAPRLPATEGWPWLPHWSWARWPWLQQGLVNLQGPEAIHEARLRCLREDGYELRLA